MVDYNMVGPALVLGLGTVGSSIGCSIAGMASHGVMSRVEEGHGLFIGLSAAPSSQSIYAFIMMILMKNAILGGTLSAFSGIFLGISTGMAFLMSSVMMGKCCATAIQATARQPAVFGKSFVAVGIVESFALFAFVFGLMLL